MKNRVDQGLAYLQKCSHVQMVKFLLVKKSKEPELKALLNLAS